MVSKSLWIFQIIQRFVFGFDFYFTVHVMVMQDTPNSNAPFLRRSSENSAKKRSYGNDIVLRPKHCSFYMEQKPIIDPRAIPRSQTALLKDKSPLLTSRKRDIASKINLPLSFTTWFTFLSRAIWNFSGQSPEIIIKFWLNKKINYSTYAQGRRFFFLHGYAKL